MGSNQYQGNREQLQRSRRPPDEAYGDRKPRRPHLSSPEYAQVRHHLFHTLQCAPGCHVFLDKAWILARLNPSDVLVLQHTGKKVLQKVLSLAAK